MCPPKSPLFLSLSLLRFHCGHYKPVVRSDDLFQRIHEEILGTTKVISVGYAWLVGRTLRTKQVVVFTQQIH